MEVGKTATCLAAAVVAIALPATMRSGGQRGAAYGVATDRVLVNAVVLDRNERLVNHLEASDFTLTVDKAPAAIETFWREDTAVSAVIVFDASGSMGPALKRARSALRGFFDLARPEDEYALVVCREEAALEVPFTTHPEEILGSAALEQAKGETPLYDALWLSLKQLRTARHQRRVIFVISDGGDNASRYSARELKHQIIEADASLYALEFWTGANAIDAPPPTSRLKEFADLTGGVYFGDVPVREFERLLSTLDIHQQYVMSFRPRARAGDGKFHPVRLQLASELKKQRLQIYWRHGYYDLDAGEVR